MSRPQLRSAPLRGSYRHGDVSGRLGGLRQARTASAKPASYGAEPNAAARSDQRLFRRIRYNREARELSADSLASGLPHRLASRAASDAALASREWHLGDSGGHWRRQACFVEPRDRAFGRRDLPRQLHRVAARVRRFLRGATSLFAGDDALVLENVPAI